LYDFHTALNGASWVFGASGTTGVKWNFTDGSCPCTQPWQGVTVATTLDVCSVHTLALGSCNLQGRIPESITNLTMLYSLALNTNLLSGTVPSFFYRITTLEHIQLNSNKMIGELICPAKTSFTQLTFSLYPSCALQDGCLTALGG
jgi:hypothetical protein